jgi:Protein of unknown function (DUF3667)
VRVVTSAPWTCPNCRQPVELQFCPSCGERRLGPHDLTLSGFAEQAIEAVSHADGRVFRSFRALLTRPGSLTLAYVNGQRKPFVGPIQLFLIANVLFYLLQSGFHMNVFGSTLHSQMTDQGYSPIARRLVAARMQATHRSVEAYESVYNHAAVVNAKSFIVVMTVPLALMAWALFYRRRPQGAAHVVFALHFYAFWMMAYYAIVATAIVAVVTGLLRGVTPSQNELIFSGMHFAITTVFLYVAIGRVYEERGVMRVVKLVPLAATTAVMLIGYRFLVLLITLYTT